MKLFNLPGGNVENNELILDALKREILEETGIQIDNPKLVCIRDKKNNIIFIFRTEIETNQIKLI